jgi:hypothetical protein
MSGAVLALFIASGACGGTGSAGFGPPPGHDGGTSPGHDGATSDGTTPMDGGGENVDSTTPDTGAHDSAPVDTGFDAGTVTSTDGFGAARTACIDTINALRATDTAVALKPYTLYNTATTNTCVDEQASNDESKDSAHYSFINNAPDCDWGKADAWAQDECEGYGTEPGAMGSGPHGTGGTGIIGCLYAMWAEQYDSNCLGCVGCTAFGGACANCDYSGEHGPECGHYVNMSAPYFTQVVCGFAAAPGTWAAQNFE